MHIRAHATGPKTILFPRGEIALRRNNKAKHSNQCL